MNVLTINVMAGEHIKGVIDRMCSAVQQNDLQIDKAECVFNDIHLIVDKENCYNPKKVLDDYYKMLDHIQIKYYASDEGYLMLMTQCAKEYENQQKLISCLHNVMKSKTKKTLCFYLKKMIEDCNGIMRYSDLLLKKIKQLDFKESYPKNKEPKTYDDYYWMFFSYIKDQLESGNEFDPFLIDKITKKIIFGNIDFGEENED